jgi:predicted amidohydrolase
VGDLAGNEAKILADYAKAEAAGCDVVVYSELTITGYPPEDLLLKKAFVRDNQLAVERIAKATQKCAALIGFVKADGDHLYNAVALCRNGGIQGVYLKQLLPNYAVFDEDRYFEPGRPRMMVLQPDCFLLMA